MRRICGRDGNLPGSVAARCRRHEFNIMADLLLSLGQLEEACDTSERCLTMDSKRMR